ncbi:hypothetical protein ACFE04_024728 [Oxalis oulophora]
MNTITTVVETNSVSHVSHSSSITPQHEGYGGGGGYVPPNTSFGQQPESGTHHSYNPGGGYVPPNASFGQQPESGTHHSYNPFHHHDQSGGGGSAGGGLDLHNRPTYRVYCKANPDFHLTIRDGQVVLARSDPSDHFQDWFKDEKFSTKVKDEEGSPCFSLVNKATGQSMKHSVGAGHPVHLVSYNPDTLDESVLWTMSKDFGDGYRTMRMVNNVHLNVDAFHGDKKSGGVHDGTTIVLWKWNKGDNQLWKVVPNPRYWLRASSAIEKSDFPDPKIREEEDFVIVEDSNAPVQMEEKEIDDGDDNFLDHENYEGTDSSVGSESDLYSQRTYKIYCKAAPDFHLTVRDGQVVLARSDPSDPFQNWFKDKAFVKQLKDEEGRPCFALVNKATAQSIKHAVGGGHPVELAPYYLDVFDESVLWTLSKDFGHGYRTMRMVNDISLNMDAFQGDEKSGGVHDGTKIVLWGWNHGDNQLWKDTYTMLLHCTPGSLLNVAQ